MSNPTDYIARLALTQDERSRSSMSEQSIKA